jgi:hypothetical protein
MTDQEHTKGAADKAGGKVTGDVKSQAESKIAEAKGAPRTHSATPKRLRSPPPTNTSSQSGAAKRRAALFKHAADFAEFAAETRA